jgi:hypothetical protein
MKLPGVLCALVLVLVLAASAPAQDIPTDRGSHGTDLPKPALMIDEITHDFGEVRSGKGLRWTFKIKNVGNADLLIHGVAPG